MIELKCPRCGKISNMKEWNKATEKEYGDGITKLFEKNWGRGYYACPKCGCDTDGDEFLEDDDNEIV